MAEQTCPCCGANLRISCNTAHPEHDCYHPDGHERPQPDWADLREIARNAGWTRERGESGTTWGHYALGAILDRSHGMAYVNKGNRRIYLAGQGGDEQRTAVLYDPTPAEALAAARLVGLIGGTS